MFQGRLGRSEVPRSLHDVLRYVRVYVSEIAKSRHILMRWLTMQFYLPVAQQIIKNVKWNNNYSEQIDGIVQVTEE